MLKKQVVEVILHFRVVYESLTCVFKQSYCLLHRCLQTTRTDDLDVEVSFESGRRADVPLLYWLLPIFSTCFGVCIHTLSLSIYIYIYRLERERERLYLIVNTI